MPTVAPGTAIQSVRGRAVAPYEHRRPVETTLYQLVQEHVETCLGQGLLEIGAGLTQFVEGEFEAFLECGILAHGFLRLRCGVCVGEKTRIRGQKKGSQFLVESYSIVNLTWLWQMWRDKHQATQVST